MEAAQAYRDALQRLRATVRRSADEAQRSLVDQAVGLLAGRVGCRLAEARTHLAELAHEQRRGIDEVAAGLIDVLEAPTSGADLIPAAAVSRLVRGTFQPRAEADPTAEQVQKVLDTVPTSAALWSPEFDADGGLVDLVMAAVSPAAVDVAGRRGAELIGMRMSSAYPEVIGTERWAIYAEVLATGESRQVGPFNYIGQVAGVPAEASFSTWVHRLGGHLLVGWIAHDEDARQLDRLRQTERLANVGFGEWDLRTGHVEWSEQLYRIFERDPADGPMTLAEIEAISMEADLPVRLAAAEAFERGERTDVVARVRINDQIKHIRTVADAVRDATGQPLKIYGIVQDVTLREVARSRLVQVERQLEQQRRSLDAEHRLASQLQTIILPIPEEPFDLPGLRVALRYLPAEQVTHVGGDWYHAAALPDGAVLLAIGDVAGHGILAATLMAQLRHALRALTVATTDPPQLMSYLNRLMVDVAQERPACTATAIIARYEPATRVLTWCAAGHPAPLLTRDGVTAVLEQPPSLLLGVRDDVTYASSAITVGPRDVLLLYTDGLVEHRQHSLNSGLASVIRAVDDAIASSPHQPLAALLGRLRPANPDDDTCILAARPIPSEGAP